MALVDCSRGGLTSDKLKRFFFPNYAEAFAVGVVRWAVS
jgi:hypothetical protein